MLWYVGGPELVEDYPLENLRRALFWSRNQPIIAVMFSTVTQKMPFSASTTPILYYFDIVVAL